MILSTGGGHAWLPGGACVVARWGIRGCHGGHVWLPGGVYGCGGGWLWGACMAAGGMRGGRGGVHGIRRDTINERAVRILLECILVRLCNNMMIYFQKGNSASSL